MMSSAGCNDIPNHKGKVTLTLISRMDRVWYPEFERNWDDSFFRERIMTHLRSDSIVLDLGAGAGILPQMNFRSVASRVCGLDVDPRVADNPMLDEGRVADAAGIPYEDAYFNIVFANNVIEHLSEPLHVFCEVARVLKPGGIFLFKTPNRRHYVPTLARLTPHRFHQYINRLRGRSEADTFPTLYRANTRAAVMRYATRSGMSVERLEYIEGRPEYLRITWPTYLVGAGYERLVNASEAFASFRVLIIGTLRKCEGVPVPCERLV
jgi:SAM-dependent methyltransferase